jgi:flagellar biogenesis protein FliO
MPSTSRHLVVLFLVAGLGQAMAQGRSSAGNPDPPNDRPGVALRAAEGEPDAVRPGPTHNAVDARPSSPAARKAPIPLPSTSRTDRGSAPGAALSKSGWRGVATLGGSLAVVLGLFFVVAWVMRRTASGAPALLPSEVVEVLGRAALAGRQQVHLIRLGAKLVLVSASPTGIETLSEVTEADEVQRLVGLCRREHASSATAVFRRVFEQFSREPGPTARWTDGPSAARPSQVTRSEYSDNLREETDG